jgi:polyisoprenoid-binding protein YceI
MTARFLGVVAISFAASAARAEPAAYKVARTRGDVGVVVEVPYSLGTHKETLVSMLGEVQLDPQGLTVTGGRLVVPISAIRSDNAERDCHLRESLGLDYHRSRFPGEHVCDEGHRIPASGADSVAYPEVILTVQRGGVLDDAGGFEGGKEVRAEVVGSWTIHGVTRPARLALTLSADRGTPGGIRVRGRQRMSLRDYGVVVKSAKVLFATISVKDEVTVLLDVLLVPSRPAGPAHPEG